MTRRDPTGELAAFVALCNALTAEAMTTGDTQALLELGRSLAPECCAVSDALDGLIDGGDVCDLPLGHGSNHSGPFADVEGARVAWPAGKPTAPHSKWFVLALSADTMAYLGVLGWSVAIGGEHRKQDVTEVLQHLAHSAADGVRRPGSWERSWLISAFSENWTKHTRPHPTVRHHCVPEDEDDSQRGWYFALHDVAGEAKWHVMVCYALSERDADGKLSEATDLFHGPYASHGDAMRVANIMLDSRREQDAEEGVLASFLGVLAARADVFAGGAR